MHLGSGIYVLRCSVEQPNRQEESLEAKLLACLLYLHKKQKSYYLADALQIHGVYNDFIIVRHKLFVDRMVKRPRL